MSDIRLFKINGQIKELKGTTVLIEKEIQALIENNMLDFFGTKFIKSEWVIDEGRMDSVGIDEDNSPVIFEYKRTTNENVINQGLFYLDWLLKHKDSFKLLVIEKYGMELANKIDWSLPKVFCIAGDFNKYDENAINQINRKVTLVRYRKYENELILFEQLNTNKVAPLDDSDSQIQSKTYIEKTFTEQLETAPKKFVDIYEELKEFALNLGDDVSQNILKLYTAFRKIKNFATVEIYQSKILLNLKLNPDEFNLDDDLEDIRKVGHWGCGDLRLTIKDSSQIERAKELITKSYEIN